MLKSTLLSFMSPLLLLFGNSWENSQPKQIASANETVTVQKLIPSSGNVTIDLDPGALNSAAVTGKSADTADTTREEVVVACAVLSAPARGNVQGIPLRQRTLHGGKSADTADATTATGKSADTADATTLRFAIAPNSFFTVIVSNDELRGPIPGAMELVAQESAANLPAPLQASLHQLMLEKTQSDTHHELVIRDSRNGFTFFEIEGQQYDYDAATRTFNITGGRLLVSEEFAKTIGRAGRSGDVAGKISVSATMQPVEIQTVVNGELQSAVMPPLRRNGGGGAEAGTVPGPDVIVGDLRGQSNPPYLQQFGNSVNGFVGLAVGTDSCNRGTEPLNWFSTPNNDHPVIPQNLYRMSGGASNTDRFEQVGQSNVKHAFTALQNDQCNFGCVSNPNGTRLGSGCSDPYSVSLNAGPNLGSRAWINPFTGAYPRGDSATPPNNHTGHAHDDTSHRILVQVSDLNTNLNPGATYYAEAQYVTPHEYAWCQSHPGECNMYNNVSYRRFDVTGTTSFTFTAVGATAQMQPAIKAWAGASINQFEPDPGNDGIGFAGSKVTNPSPGIWHYEYAIYNENLDRAIQSFSVPLGAGVNVSNAGFHAPPQHPGWSADGTQNNQGYSSAAWTSTVTSTSVTWNCETFAQNQNANAIRWGTLYNFRFDANAAPASAGSPESPQAGNATIGFFKTGSPIGVQVDAPGGATPAPTPTPNPTPTPTPTPTPMASPTPTPDPSIVTAVNLPTAAIDISVTNLTLPVTTTEINPAVHGNLHAFQGDFTFDSSVITFQNPPVETAELTSGGGWSLAASVIGTGQIKTLRVSCFSVNNSSLDSTGLGTQPLFNLRMTRVGSAGQSSDLTWAASPNNFVFIDNLFVKHAPASTPPGNINISLVGTVSLPNATVATSVTNFTQPVTTTEIDPQYNLLAFQGDFTFDSTVIGFQNPPVETAGLTTNGSWSLLANVLGSGQFKTLRVSCFAAGNSPLDSLGQGTQPLFNLRMVRLGSAGQSTPLVWAASPNNFVFIDNQFVKYAPGSTPAGGVSILALVNISGNVTYCSGSPRPVPYAVLTLSGSSTGSTQTNTSGNYTLSSVPAGGTYTVTPAGLRDLQPVVDPKPDTSDALRVQAHFQSGGTLLSGCQEMAAHVTGNITVSVGDALAIQQFFGNNPLGANNSTGQWRFIPASRTYPNISTNASVQDYTTYVLGDVTGGVVFPTP